jgi:hypothetical protein
VLDEAMNIRDGGVRAGNNQDFALANPGGDLRSEKNRVPENQVQKAGQWIAKKIKWIAKKLKERGARIEDRVIGREALMAWIQDGEPPGFGLLGSYLSDEKHAAVACAELPPSDSFPIFHNKIRAGRGGQEKC